MTAQYIGKGMYRITVQSERRRNRLQKIPGIRIEDDRVYFSSERRGMVENAGKSRRNKLSSIQLELF